MYDTRGLQAGRRFWIILYPFAITLLLAAAAQQITGCPFRRPMDLNGDGMSDFTVVRGGNPSVWFTLVNGGPFLSTSFGGFLDTFAPGDFDGDSKTDIAVYRSGTQGTYFILQSTTNTMRTVPFGLANDEARVVGDYDGDGKTDPAIYRAGIGTNPSAWIYLGSIDGQVHTILWGRAGDIRAPGDYDGDGKYDFVVRRNVGGKSVFLRKFSGGGTDSITFGLFNNDEAVPGYYDGDCKQDIAVIRDLGQSTPMQWFILNSSDQALRSVTFGINGMDRTAQGDYDGDGVTDICVWRDPLVSGQTGTFFFLRSTNNSLGTVNWGLSGDVPAAFFNNH